VEFLDSSTVGLTEREGHDSRLDILKNMHSLLSPIAHAKGGMKEGSNMIGETIGAEWIFHLVYLSPLKCCGFPCLLPGKIEGLGREERGRLYTRLSMRCASQIGSLCLQPPGLINLDDVQGALQWYARSDTPVAQVLAGIKALPSVTDTGWNEALLNYLEDTLLVDEAERSGLMTAPPLFDTRGGITTEKLDVVLELAELFARERKDKLPELVLSPQVPWLQHSTLRDKARELLGDDDTSLRTRLALLALEAWDMKEMLELQGNVQVDRTTSTASVDLPAGFQQHMDEFLRLSQGLQVNEVVRICRYAHDVVVKSLPVQGLSLVVKGPLFDHLGAQSPESLAQMLAQMTTTWCHQPALDVIQVFMIKFSLLQPTWGHILT